MDVTMTARHCTVPAPVRRRADERVRALRRFEARISSGEVTFQTDHGEHQVEVRVFVRGGRTVVSHGAADDFRTALDQAVDRLRRRLSRQRERRRVRHGGTRITELTPALDS